MSHTIRNTIMLSATALALIAAPVLMNQTALSDLQAIARDNGHGGGNSDGGGGGGNGNGGGNGGSENSNAGGNGNGGGGSESKKSEGKAKKVADTEAVTTTTKLAKATKTKNLNAQLAGLNSLKRNINGLMNSSDPRMDGIREFIVASVALDAAEAESAAAIEAFLAAKGDYLDLLDELNLTPDTTPASLREQIDAIVIPEDDPATLDVIEGEAELAEKLALETALTEIEDSGLWTALVDASDAAQAEAEDLAKAQEAAGPEAFDDALLMAANKNRRSEDYLTDDIRNWAGGIVDGLVEDYAETQE